MTDKHKHSGKWVDPARALERKIALTRAGMLAERLVRAFWPLSAVLMVLYAMLAFGLHSALALEYAYVVALLVGTAVVWALGRGVWTFRWPGRDEAAARLDRSLPGRPVAALTDRPVIGGDNSTSLAVWRAHLARMQERMRSARPVSPDLRLAGRDRFALRYVAATAFAVALVFGTIDRREEIAEVANAAIATEVAAGPSWEAWAEPPGHTGKPAIYLNEVDDADPVSLPQGTRVVVRFYGDPAGLAFGETISGQAQAPLATGEFEREMVARQSGELKIGTDVAWRFEVIPDAVPLAEITGEPEVSLRGAFKLPWTASDDYGVESMRMIVTLNRLSLDRRHGLSARPDPRDPIILDVPLPVRGDRLAIEGLLQDELAKHPWAGLAVRITPQAVDAAGQISESAPLETLLPGRRFLEPLAAAIAEQRRDLLWAKANAPRVAQLLRAISHDPEDVFDDTSAYLILRTALRRLEFSMATGPSDEVQADVAEMLWQLAVLLEDGDVGDAAEALRRAQDRLSEAMRRGASDEEIAELMEELRRAMEDYLRALAQDSEGEDFDSAQDQNRQEITGDQLQELMDRIEELAREGRMAEAQQLLDQLREMMENMEVTRRNGQQGGDQGQQAMEGLRDTLRQQQGLADDAFRDLQEQFNGGSQAGQSDQNQGRSGDRGSGQAHEGQGQGQGERLGQGDAQSGDLADRQEALRRQLEAQEGGLPGAGTPEGDAAREALRRAGRAMDQAEDALRQNQMGDALERQAEAIDALRDGIRNLGEALAQQQDQNRGGQGQQSGAADPQRSDPLGRRAGTNGRVGSDEELLGGPDAARRARELLDEIRRRTGERTRPEQELDYLKRLLDRF